MSNANKPGPKQLGISEEKINDIGDDRHRASPHFTEAEKALMDLTVQIGIDANRVSEELLKCPPRVRSLPQVFIAGRHIGGFEAIQPLGESGKLDDLVDRSPQ